MSAPPLTVTRATAVALAAGAALLAVFVALGWRGFDAAWAGLDFNAALFEDFLGPYWQTADALAAGQCAPAKGYLYPAFGAWLLAPITALGDAAASWACAGLMLGAAALLLASLFTLRPPRGPQEAAAVGIGALLAHPLVHGAYWGQAALPVAALTLAAFATWSRGRTVTGGLLLGVAAAIKLTPHSSPYLPPAPSQPLTSYPPNKEPRAGAPAAPPQIKKQPSIQVDQPHRLRSGGTELGHGLPAGQW